jgi:4-amino-4-deoxy-L-arabinose transferase-like glycosyltransferase
MMPADATARAQGPRLQGSRPRGFGKSSASLRWLVLCAILLFAFGVRVYHIDYQSLWSDEGISLQRASLPLPEMLRTMPVEQAPGYFVLLRFWLAGVGPSDFALRFLSLWASLLAVAIGYRLAADLGSRRAGVVAALLLATNGFQIWYAQEARMYSWLLASSLGATWLLTRLLSCAPGSQKGAEVPRSRWYPAYWAGYVLLMALMVYLQHYGFTVAVAHGVFALIWLWRTRDTRRFVRWAAAGAAVVLLYLPWLPRFVGIFGFSGWRPALDPWQLPWRYLTAYTVSDAMPAPWHGWLPSLYLLLALAGVLIWWRNRRLAATLLAVCTVVPLMGAFAIALRQSDYHERYTIMLSAPLMVLSAVGLVEIGRPHRAGQPRRAASMILTAFVLSGLVGANALALRSLYFDSRLHKPDFRAAAQRIQALEQPGDVILVDGPDPEKVFLHYYRGNARVFDLRPLSQASEAEVDATLTAATEGAPRAWGLLYFHPPGPVQAWLARRGWPAASTFHNGIFVTLYGLPTAEASAEQAHPSSTEAFTPPVTFSPDLVLKGAEISCPQGATAGETASCRAGDLLRLRTSWEASGPPPERKFSARLQDAAGRVWVAEDYVPQDGFAPTETWQPGQPVSDQHGLLLPADLPPGPYRATLRLYDPATGAAVPALLRVSSPADNQSAGTQAAEEVVLGEISVLPQPAPPDPTGLGIPQSVDRALNDELQVIGFGTTPQPLRSGQPGILTIWWRVDRQPSVPYQVQAELLDRSGAVVARGLAPLSVGLTDLWQPAEVVREQYPLEIDPTVASGDYRLRLSLISEDGQALGEQQELGRVTIEARPRQYRLPTVDHRVDAALGESIVLRGYDLDQAEDRLELTLYWQAKGQVPGRYKVFLHLVDASGQIAAQSDSIPAAGTAPTQSWLPGEVVIDRHTLTPPAGGAYRLFAGMYDPVSGERLPATDQAGNLIPDAAVLLEEIEVP